VAAVQTWWSRRTVRATYLGGSGDDYAYGIALDSQGNALVVGQTDSVDFVGAGNTISAAIATPSWRK